MHRAAIPLALCFGALTLGLVPSNASLPISPSAAHAAVSIAYGLDELVSDSRQVAIVRPVERKSLWEEVAGARRIVTYTKVEVLERVFTAGNPATKKKTLWIRTLGGSVDRIGQQVAGEARFRLGRRSLVFLTRSTDAKWVVSGMSQGHFPVREARNGSPAVLVTSRSHGTLLPRRGPSISVHERLVNLTVVDALDAIRESKARVDAARSR